MRKCVFFLATAALLAGCGGGVSRIQLPDDGLRGVPSRITLAGQTLTLDSYLWRDFQPVTPPGGKPMIGTFRVGTADGAALSAGFSVDAISVLQDEKSWESAPTESRPGPSAHQREWIARDGPKWATGTTVNVVVRLRDPDGKTLLLKQESAPIHRTD